MTWTSIWVIYSLEAITVPSLAKMITVRDIERTTLFSDQHLDLDLWPCELKINRGHLFSRVIHCNKFGNFQVKGLKDHLVHRPTNRQTDQLTCPQNLAQKKIQSYILATSFTFPESMTYTTSLMVMLLSAIFVARIWKKAQNHSSSKHHSYSLINVKTEEMIIHVCTYYFSDSLGCSFKHSLLIIGLHGWV